MFRTDEETYHFGMEINNLVLERYHIDKAVENYPSQKYYSCDIDKAVECLELIYYLRVLASKYMDTSIDGMKISRKMKEHCCLYYLMQKSREISHIRQRKSIESQIADIDIKI